MISPPFGQNPVDSAAAGADISFFDRQMGLGPMLLRKEYDSMAKSKKKSTKATKATKARKTGDLIISKARTKAAVRKCNVSSDFYPALDKVVRTMLKGAEDRAIANKRKTVRPQDL